MEGESSHASSMLHRALAFAAKAHDRQTRKYTGDPYIVHPVEVMGLIVAHCRDPYYHRPEVLAAAVLHDVVEDTPVSLNRIEVEFGKEVRDYVEGLTDIYGAGYRDEKGHRLNRAERKAKEAWRLAQCGSIVQTIKCADLISNSRTIVEFDREFAKTYIPEKRAILSGLLRAESNLWMLAQVTLEASEAKIAA
jgi:(p)ppGpp synthase/HD superfamily hydrolase